MISVFRGPRVPPFGSVCRLLAVVAIFVANFWNFRTGDYHTFTFFPASFLYRFHHYCGEEKPFGLPFTSKCLSSKKKLSVFTSIFAACHIERYRPHRKRFDDFHSIFPFRAPLTEMTRLLLVGCFKCTQFNLSFRFTFLLQSRSSLCFGHQLFREIIQN